MSRNSMAPPPVSATTAPDIATSMEDVPSGCFAASGVLHVTTVYVVRASTGLPAETHVTDEARPKAPNRTVRAEPGGTKRCETVKVTTVAAVSGAHGGPSRPPALIVDSKIAGGGGRQEHENPDPGDNDRGEGRGEALESDGHLGVPRRLQAHRGYGRPHDALARLFIALRHKKIVRKRWDTRTISDGLIESYFVDLHLD